VWIIPLDLDAIVRLCYFRSLSVDSADSIHKKEIFSTQTWPFDDDVHLKHITSCDIEPTSNSISEVSGEEFFWYMRLAYVNTSIRVLVKGDTVYFRWSEFGDGN
jgi:hypothetical protein